MKQFIPFLFSLSLCASDEMGSLLFHGNCTTCHFETQEVSAPAMAEVRKRYMQAFSKKEDFVTYLSNWVADPNQERSIMQDAIQKHGLMPHLGYEKEVLRDIASYIYDTDFNKPHNHIMRAH